MDRPGAIPERVGIRILSSSCRMIHCSAMETPSASGSGRRHFSLKDPGQYLLGAGSTAEAGEDRGGTEDRKHSGHSSTRRGLAYSLALLYRRVDRTHIPGTRSLPMSMSRYA